MKAPKTELAWAAGLFDGEGNAWVGYHKARGPFRNPELQCKVSIGQTDPVVLKRFKKATGVGNINGPYRRKPPRKPVWTLVISKQADMLKVWKVLKQFLSKPKQQQFKRMFKALAVYKKGRKIRLSKAASLRAERQWQ